MKKTFIWAAFMFLLVVFSYTPQDDKNNSALTQRLSAFTLIARSEQTDKFQSLPPASTAATILEARVEILSRNSLPTPGKIESQVRYEIAPTPVPTPVPTIVSTPRPLIAPKAPLSPSGEGSVDMNTVWDRLAMCEASGNWKANTGNGYYGGLQFDIPTWRSYGGTGMPHEHSREQQIAIATKLHAVRGFQPWPSCRVKLGLP